MSDLLPPGSKVLTFNPDSYLVQNKVNFPTQSFTVSCWLSWVKPQYQNSAFASYATGPDSATIMNYDEDPDGSGGGTRFGITSPSNVAAWVGGSSTGPTGIDVSNGDWYHLAVILTPKDANHYAVKVIKNGGEKVVEQKIYHDEGVKLRSGSQLILGQRYWGGQDDRFIGQFAEFTIWDHVRSLADISRDMTTPLSGNEQGLVLYWPLDAAPPGVKAGHLTFVDSGGEQFGFDFSGSED